MKKAIILANGVFPHRNEALQALLQTPLLICCDGAYNKLVSNGLFLHATATPEVHVVGDGDSINTDTMHHPPFPTTFIHSYTDQDTNDLTKAVKYALTLGMTHAVVLGATGLREDHTLGNLSLLASYAAMTTAEGSPLNIRIYSDYGTFTPIRQTTRFASVTGQQVSLFALNPPVTVTAEGLKYPLQRRQLRYWWEATLNEALDDHFTVSLNSPGELLVYQTHECKTS